MPVPNPQAPELSSCAPTKLIRVIVSVDVSKNQRTCRRSRTLPWTEIFVYKYPTAELYGSCYYSLCLNSPSLTRRAGQVCRDRPPKELTVTASGYRLEDIKVDGIPTDGLGWLKAFPADVGDDILRKEIETKGVLHVRGVMPRDFVLEMRRK
jgi:hypothetical protein